MAFFRPVVPAPHPTERSTETTTAEFAVPPPATSKVASPARSTTITITVRSKTTTISTEKEKQAQPTSSEVSSPTQSGSDTSLGIQMTSASSTQGLNTTATSTTSQASITPATTFGLGDGKQLVHSGALTGTTIATDGSTFTHLATPSSNTAQSHNRLPKPVIIGIAASGCIALVSLMAVIIWCTYKDRHKRRKERGSGSSADPEDREVGLRSRMRQSSQVKRLKISHPFTPVYDQPATVSVRDLQNSAPWNIPRSVASSSSQNVLLPTAPSTSEAISPYGGYTTSDNCAGNNSPLTSNIYPSPPALRIQKEQAGVREFVREYLAPVSSPQNQPRSLASSSNAGQSSSTQRPQPTVTRTPTTTASESIWDDEVSIVKPHIDMQMDAYPSRSRVDEEYGGKRPSLEQDRRDLSMLSDHQHASAWRNTALNTFSVASSHPSLRVPERGDWKQNDRGIRETMMSDGEDIWSDKGYDPRDDLPLKREEIKGLRVSAILADRGWERARKLFSGESF
ncbi:hypothetical protein B9Z19DRAFT_1073602 [Tuber borchii]|uniref:Uncharacterized protein n=1 Tax=Tuber borchii TaxID=42251 RepID=A0A2T7A5Q1_TUBBO|nr:hypothetical protein B9Z19DRAFT_1073602 [Tuber borchii]